MQLHCPPSSSRISNHVVLECVYLIVVVVAILFSKKYFFRGESRALLNRLAKPQTLLSQFLTSIIKNENLTIRTKFKFVFKETTRAKKMSIIKILFGKFESFLAVNSLAFQTTLVLLSFNYIYVLLALVSIPDYSKTGLEQIKSKAIQGKIMDCERLTNGFAKPVLYSHISILVVLYAGLALAFGVYLKVLIRSDNLDSCRTPNSFFCLSALWLILAPVYSIIYFEMSEELWSCVLGAGDYIQIADQFCALQDAFLKLGVINLAGCFLLLLSMVYSLIDYCCLVINVETMPRPQVPPPLLPRSRIILIGYGGLQMGLL